MNGFNEPKKVTRYVADDGTEHESSELAIRANAIAKLTQFLCLPEIVGKTAAADKAEAITDRFTVTEKPSGIAPCKPKETP